jgi:hypothetical protein
MSSRTLTARWTRWLFLGVFLCVAASPSRGLVLCIEPGGSVAIEVELSACCGRDAVIGATGAAAASSDLSSCACVDVQLITSPTRTERGLTRVTVPMPSVAGALPAESLVAALAAPRACGTLAPLARLPVESAIHRLTMVLHV